MKKEIPTALIAAALLALIVVVGGAFWWFSGGAAEMSLPGKGQPAQQAPAPGSFGRPPGK